MTPEELDVLFPNRRAELTALGLSPDSLRIPAADISTWTAEQCQAVFPHFADVWRSVLASQAAHSESDPS